MLFTRQRTLAHSVRCSGKGLHTGNVVELTLLPAAENTGIVFERTDVAESNPYVMAHFSQVSDTMLGTTLCNREGVKVATIEHLMAALSGLGVDNVRVQLNGAEVPIMDGSAEPFVFLLECAGIAEQQAMRKYLRVRRPVRCEVDGSWAELRPYDGFHMDIQIAFDNPVIANQQKDVDFSRSTFKESLGRARTFGFAEDVERLQAAGLARGGSLENAIVLDKNGILNKEGLRYQDEFVRHKMLDCVGDLYLAGAQILGRFEGFRTGHTVHHRLLTAMMQDDSAWEWVQAPVAVDGESSSIFPAVMTLRPDAALAMQA